MEDEHVAINRRQDELLNENASLTKEVSRLQSHCDQLTHQYTVESSNKDLALLRDRNAWSTEREDLNKQLASVRRALTDAKHVESELQEKLTEKEREMANRVRAAREEEWTKARVLDQERRDAEDRLAKAQLVMQDERTRLIFERKEVEKVRQ